MENLRLVFGEEVPEPAAVHVTRWSQVGHPLGSELNLSLARTSSWTVKQHCDRRHDPVLDSEQPSPEEAGRHICHPESARMPALLPNTPPRSWLSLEGSCWTSLRWCQRCSAQHGAIHVSQALHWQIF